MSAEVLLVEDEPTLRALIRDLLEPHGYRVEEVGDLAGARRWLATRAPDLLLLDIKLPDGDGLDLLSVLRDQGARFPAVVLTAFGTVDRAVRAMQAGAADFLVKPFDNQRFLGAVAGALAAGARLGELELHAGTVGDSPQSRQLVGDSGGLAEVVAVLRRVAAVDATVLVAGESGTGKELVARALHEWSPRRDQPFVALNCSALPSSLLESELFGFERGAFTGAHAQKKGLVETAHGGTLFLDEIGDMAIEAQARLLRVLQEREVIRVGGRNPVHVDVRVVAATHRDLEQRVKEGLFRADLLYRLRVVPVRLPSLRERQQDIPGLVAHFLEKHGQRLGLTLAHPDPEMMARLIAHPWPGNVRELENLVERAVVLGDFRRAFGLSGENTAPNPPRPAAAETAVRTLKEAVAEAERAAVVAALRHAQGNKAEAARLLGVSYKTLFNKIHEHQIREAVSIE